MSGTYKTIAGFLMIILVMACCCAANADAGMWGVANGWNVLVTMLYMLFWVIFPKLAGKNGFLMKTGYIISIITFVAAVCSMICVLADGASALYAFMLIPSLAGLITTAPFYGLTYFLYGMPGKFEVYYPVVMVIALCWIFYMRWWRKRNG